MVWKQFCAWIETLNVLWKIHTFFLLEGRYLIFHFTWQISIPHQQCANSGVWQMTLMCWMCACVFKGLRQRQAVLQHSEHQKQLWIIRVQLSWPYAEALETWSSGTLLWVDKDVCHETHFLQLAHTLCAITKLLNGWGGCKLLWSFGLKWVRELQQ